MPYKGGVQLLPETQRKPTLASYASGNGLFWAGVVIGAVILVATAIFASYRASLQARIDELDGRLQATEDARNKEQERALLDASKQSRTMRSLLASKLYWSQALELMEEMARTSVRFTSLRGSVADNIIEFTAVADSYASVARQIKAFTEATGITDVRVVGISAASDGSIEFQGELDIDSKELLTKPASSRTSRP